VSPSAVDRFRRSGADIPGGDPRPSHLAEMEGYFWRITHPERRLVVLTLCGVNRAPDGYWATVALAAYPAERVWQTAAPSALASTQRLEVSAQEDGREVFVADDRRVVVDLGADARLEVELDDVVGWPHRLGGGGLFSAVPWLNQYWHPHILGARVSGHAVVGGERYDLEGATAYAEKNWGAGFPKSWWWGQAQGFDRDDVCVAFSGGVLEWGPVSAGVGGVVVRVGDDVLRLCPPTALVRGGEQGGTWRVTARDLRTQVEITGDGGGSEFLPLPVPLPAERFNVDTDFEHLGGRLHLSVRRDGRILYEGETTLAGLETGSLPG